MEVAARVGRYEILFRIAGGGMAEVFAARVRGEAGFQKIVAVKRVLPHLADEPSIGKMFLDEARVAANISSPHVVQTLDLGRTDDGTPYLVMELVLGIDLAEILKLARRARRSVPLDAAIEILAQAAIGLHAAHEARTPAGEPMRLVHRDISPQNLLVGADGRVRVTDFGIAWVAFERLTETTNGTYKGKYAYFSPEQSRRAALDRRSDVFALGIVAWETLAGRRLFARDDLVETITAIRDGDVPPLRELRPEVPEEVEAAVRRALALEPGDRFETARELADALRAAARANGIEPSDTAVAELLAGLESPRLAALAERLRQFASSPGVSTLPDIEPGPEPEAPHTRVVGEQAANELAILAGEPRARRRPRSRVRVAIAGVTVLAACAGVLGAAVGLLGGDADPPAPVSASASEAPADLAPADRASADLAPADLAPADRAPADLAPADRAPADRAPADRAPADLAPAQPDTAQIAAAPEQAPADSPPDTAQIAAAPEHAEAPSSEEQQAETAPAGHAPRARRAARAPSSRAAPAEPSGSTRTTRAPFSVDAFDRGARRAH